MNQLPLQITLFNDEQHTKEVPNGRRAIEADDFPIEKISDVAERESWRKEINRPIYHVHKWWAQRLGSVFRSILIGALSPEGARTAELFYQPVKFRNAVVFDPFMGSGTTLGEALKLGCRAIGRDINPVAYFAVRTALQKHPKEDILAAFASLEQKVKSEILKYYQTRTPEGNNATVLYYFWVKTLECEQCGDNVDLFSKYIFAQHAYPKKHPKSQCVCPECGDVNVVDYDSESATCTSCKAQFNPRQGPAKGTKATCPSCQHSFSIAATARKQAEPPKHRLYAKLVLQADGTKRYLPANHTDHELYARVRADLEAEDNLYPVVEIEPGYNTDQALNYGYRFWHEMFNDRQLLCLGMLGREISRINDPYMRDAMLCLFSGALEFNNMFASYKGEGTGAVRHMFYHHILKPERTPLEANPWGTPKSSGAFSTLFKSRLLRAIEYCESPFELSIQEGKAQKVFGLSDPLGHERQDNYSEFKEDGRLYLSCGDSADTDLEDECVDVIVTDPPFFDNVNYSQLADFFFVWQRHVLGGNGIHTTRTENEVQQQDANVFSEKLTGVLRECNRVLKPDGLLAFSYHHSRSEGWSSVLRALSDAGFVITASQPMKAEMSVATPKQQAKEPIDLDIILVCRKRRGGKENGGLAQADAESSARAQINRLRASGRRLSRNDIRVILMGQLLKQESSVNRSAPPEEVFGAEKIEATIEKLFTELG